MMSKGAGYTFWCSRYYLQCLFLLISFIVFFRVLVQLNSNEYSLRKSNITNSHSNKFVSFEVTTTSYPTTEIAVYRLNHHSGCSGMYWRNDPRISGGRKEIQDSPLWPRNNALLRGNSFKVTFMPEGMFNTKIILP